MDIQEVKKQMDYLEETKGLLKDAIVSKGQSIESNDTFRSYVGKIDNIVTLDEGTADANATAGDIANNKTAYVNGIKVTGNVRDIANGSASSFINTNFTITNNAQHNILDFSLPFTLDVLHRQGSTEQLNCSYDKVATAISLASNQIKAGETILGVAGSVIELNGDTETVTPTTSQQIITPTSPKNGLTQVTVNAVTSAIDSNIQTENIKRGVTILGISGKSSVVDTSDANAVANDIVERKKAYVNGNKITGTMYHFGGMVQSENYNRAEATSYRVITNGTPRQVIFNCDVLNSNQYIPAGNYVQVFAILDDFNSYIGLTADKLKVGKTVLGVAGSVVELNGETASVTPTTSQQTIVPTGTDKNALTEVTVNAVTSAIDQNIVASNIKDGVTILGVTGTYITPMKEYNSISAMNNDIENIDAQEIVKVVSGGVTTYYIKDGTPVTYQPLDLSTLATGDTISLKGMKINSEATSNVITGNGDVKSITFSNNGQDVLELAFRGGAINISGSLTINGSTTYNYSGVAEGQNSVLSSADVEAINSNAIWNSDDLLTITKSYTTISREIENAILEQVGGYSMVKLIKETETLSQQEFNSASSTIESILGEE